MKRLILFISLIQSLLLNSALWSQQVPENWYKNTITTNKDNSDEEKKFGMYLGEVSDSYLTMLDSMPENNEKGNSHWEFDEYRALYSLSLHGLFGITGLRSTSAIETRWVKKKNKVEKNEKEFDVMIKSDASQEDIIKSFNPFLNEAMKRRLIQSESVAQKELRGKVENIQKILNEIAEYQSLGNKSVHNWEAKFLRIDFTIGVSGKILSFAKIGTEFRFRTIWKIPHHSSPVKNNLSEQEQERRENLFGLLENLSDDIEEAYEDSRQEYLEEIEDNEKGTSKIDFDIESIGVGITQEQEIKWALAQTDFRADFFLIFGQKSGVPKNMPNLALSENQNKDGDYLIRLDNDYAENKISTDNNDKSFADLFRNKRAMMRKTLRKAMKRAQFISDKMGHKKKSKWVLEKIRVDYALQKTGFLGLAGSKSRVFTEILVALKRNNPKDEKNIQKSGHMSALNEIQLRLRTLFAFKLPVVELRFFPELEFIIRR